MGPWRFDRFRRGAPAFGHSKHSAAGGNTTFTHIIDLIADESCSPKKARPSKLRSPSLSFSQKNESRAGSLIGHHWRIPSLKTWPVPFEQGSPTWSRLELEPIPKSRLELSWSCSPDRTNQLWGWKRFRAGTLNPLNFDQNIMKCGDPFLTCCYVYFIDNLRLYLVINNNNKFKDILKACV